MGFWDIRLKGCKGRGNGGLDQDGGSGAGEKWIVLKIGRLGRGRRRNEG